MFIGIMLALAVVSLIAVFVGKLVFSKLNPSLVSKVASALFVIIGILCFL